MITRRKYELAITQTDMEQRLKELHFFERMAIEESSRRKLDSTVRCYEQFCTSATIQSMPPTYVSLGLYAVQYAHRFGHTTRTLPVLFAHLKRACRERGLPWLDEAAQARLDDVVAGLRKYDHTTSARKLPMTHKVMADVQAAADMTNLSHYQHITMARVARDALLRGSELIKLRVADLVWNSNGKQATLIIHLSKANKIGPPEQVTIADYGPTSGVAFLREYVRIMGFAALGKTDVPLWPVTTPEGRVDRRRPTSKASFIALARLLLTKAGYPAKDYAGHSYRSGGATDLWDSHRCRPLAIRLHGRWKSEAYRLYIRDNPQHTAEEVAHALAFFEEATRD